MPRSTRVDSDGSEQSCAAIKQTRLVRFDGTRYTLFSAVLASD
jgi:hypothetical protein